jgi:hypothetical protein
MVSYLAVEFRREPAVSALPRIGILTIAIFLKLALPAPPAVAAGAQPLDLYSGEAVVTDQGAAERRRALPLALEQVLQKLSGLREFDDYPLVQPALERATDILLSYYYRNLEYLLADGSEAAELRLVARFSRSDVDEMARALQLPLWQPERRPLALWLVIDDGLDRRIMPVEYEYMRHALDDAALQRGIPLRWPEPGPEGEFNVDPQLLWGGYTEDLATPGGEGIMIAAARREGLEWSVRINLGFDGRHQAWRLNDIDLQAALVEGFQAAVDQVAALDTIAASDIGSWSQELVVDGLNGPEDYRRCLNYLQGISIVEQVSVVSARPGAVTFRLDLSAIPDYLAQSLESDQVMERAETGEAWELVRIEADDG